MNVLFACHRFPFPPDRGGKIRPFNMVRHLARNHCVTVASVAHSERELALGAGLREFATEVIAEVLPSWRRWSQAWAALPTHLPSSVAYFRSPALMRRLRERAAARRFDCIVVHCAYAAQYVAAVPCERRVLDFGDLDSAKWAAYARHRAAPLSLGYRVEAEKLRRYEKQLAPSFTRCTVTTSREQEDFNLLGTAVPCTIIPNGVDISYFSRRHDVPSDAHTIVFVGHMQYFPNVQGIEKFVRDVFPAIRRSVPDAVLKIVGAEPTRRVRNLAHKPGVVVTGGVPDVRPFLEEAAVSVAPMQIARGVQNKILEAMAAGVPVVTTPEAAKGVHAVANQHFFIAETAEQFAAHVIRLLHDPQLSRQLSAAARAQVERVYSWDAALATLDDVLESDLNEMNAGAR